MNNATAELGRMKRSLKQWLKYRRRNDEATGVMLVRVGERDWGIEQKLANELHVLLSEVFDAGLLPSPNIQRNPDAAVQLAEIAISGQLPNESAGPEAQGIVWMWPLVIVAGGLAFVATTAIRSYADVAKEKERLACIRAGACTDSGFWLKVGAIAFVGWFAWEKMGVGGKVKKLMK
jgi:hypothetical protein